MPTIVSNLQPFGNLAGQPNPSEGLVGLPISLDMSGANVDFLVDFTINQQGGKFSAPRTMFIDNSPNPEVVNVFVQGSGQTFTVPPFSAGYFKISSTTTASKIELSSPGGATDLIFLEFYNYNIAPVVWNGFGPIGPNALISITGANGTTVASPSNPLPVEVLSSGTNYTNRSATLVAATDTVIAPANVQGYQCRIRNIGDGAGGGVIAFYRQGATAAGGFPTAIQLPISQEWMTFPYTITAALHVFCPTITNIECETW